MTGIAVTKNKEQTRHQRDDLALDGLSFLLADVQDNLGNFLTAFLTIQSWPSNRIGAAIAAGGLGAVLARFAGGWALDIFPRRRLMLAVCCAVTFMSVTVMAWAPLFYPIVLAHFIAGGAGALFTPVLPPSAIIQRGPKAILSAWAVMSPSIIWAMRRPVL
ncbi:hypothetical protein GCM10007866_21350 [Gluconobacter albidus]|uniref:Major facilitator superfamily (MFS) profile domain-containing protein n=1 Tax=Gluconobacter albidus TaxID=318683 RepID=A0ABQ5X491_9PROT|nr:hypothetical protein GCM10007866_21350 [Gluconobacter albidus]